MDPLDLLRRMADTYAGANTYRDRGRARHRRITGVNWSEERRTFATFLDRRQGFRFDLVKPTSGRPVIVWTGQETSLSGRPNQTQVRLLVDLFRLHCFGPAASTGVPSLLLPREFGNSFISDFRDPKYRGDAMIGDRRCHRLLGHWREKTEVVLWLDEERFLVRQLVDRTEYPLAREASELREAHLRRRDHALAAGIPRKLVEHAFGADHLLALKHWPYATPREDSRTVTRVSYTPELGVPIDAELFRGKPFRA